MGKTIIITSISNIKNAHYILYVDNHAKSPHNMGPVSSRVVNPVYMSRKIRKFRTDKFDT